MDEYHKKFKRKVFFKTFTNRQVNRRDMILSKMMRRQTPGLQMWATKESDCYSHHIYNHVYASNPIITDD
jgi:hypothetical protein